MYTVTTVSNEKGVLTVRTAFMDKADYKKRSLHLHLMDKPPVERPKRKVLRLLQLINHKMEMLSTSSLAPWQNLQKSVNRSCKKSTLWIIPLEKRRGI